MKAKNNRILAFRQKAMHLIPPLNRKGTAQSKKLPVTRK